MYLQDTENKQSSTGASESGQLSDDSLRSEDYTSYGQGSPFPPGESAIPPKMTGGFQSLVWDSGCLCICYWQFPLSI